MEGKQEGIEKKTIEVAKHLLSGYMENLETIEDYWLILVYHQRLKKVLALLSLVR
jgi:hypothetical protein